ncbi:MAG: hypothetical protein HYX86_05370 [Chloroflexi bacterium]|nr:hypothetical protein [Chloroflexota bacterium]
MDKTITNLPNLLETLPSEKELFSRIFSLAASRGYLEAPLEMHPWIEKHFGSVGAVREQNILKVTNLITGEGALFNELRSRRPMEAPDSGNLREIIEKSRGCPFCTPLTGTPADTFGRIQGQYSITASNIAKYDGFHGLVIFHEHDPLKFSREEVADYLETALAWAKRAHQEDREARYFFFMWNSLWKAGASIIHGHAQVALTTQMPYPKVEALRQSIVEYREKYGADYFQDLFRIHSWLGLAWQTNKARIIVYLTPLKEKEILILAPNWNEDLAAAVYEVLDSYLQRLGVVSFNLAIIMPPLSSDSLDWTGFPVLARLVDRGDPLNRTVDVAAMELYAASVISSDPFAVARALKSEQPELS